MIRSDVVSGLLLAALGAYAAVKAHGFGLGALSEPGAGFFPFWAGILVVGCASAIVVHALIRARIESAVAAARAAAQAGVTDWKKIWICVAVVAAYAAALPLIGFGASTFLVMLVLSRMDPVTTWRGAVLIATLGSIGFWVMFVKLLTVRFPAPAFGF